MKEQSKLQEQITEEQLPQAATRNLSSEGASEAPAPLSGTKGRFAKYLDTFTLGDSGVWEDILGDVYFSHDIGLAGAVRTGVGVRFPDGSVQTTAASSAFNHDATLTGNGTSISLLGVAVPLTLKGSTANDQFVLTTANTGEGYGAQFIGGNDSNYGYEGVFGTGGSCNTGQAGSGVACFGGTGATGGAGIDAFGGYNISAHDNSPAGRFWGSVEINRFGYTDANLAVTETLSTGAGAIKIDHPLDPANKSLYHAFIDSPDMMNIYNGNITTDAGGEALVELPDYFEALNSDFRYQLTVIGQFAQAIIAREIKDNHFLIKTDLPNVKVSWQVTGIRRDAFANEHRIKVEVDKSLAERGYYLHPSEHGQSEEKDIASARYSALIRRTQAQVKNAREQ